jgi:hypothetical protein
VRAKTTFTPSRNLYGMRTYMDAENTRKVRVPSAPEFMIRGYGIGRTPYPAFLTALQYPPDIPLHPTEVFLCLAPTRRRRKADTHNDLPLLRCLPPP